MMRASIRLLTAFALIAMSGLAVAQGWAIVHFSLAMMNTASPDERGEVVNTWRTTSGIASTALQADLTDEINATDIIAVTRQREVLSAILSIRPLSSMEWLSLAGAQLATNQSMEDVLASLRLSTLTGPNEAYVMVQRAVFGVLLWEHLTPELKGSGARDLVPILFSRTQAEGVQSGKLQAVLSTKPEGVRKELGEALRAVGLSGDIERRLGL